MAAQHGIHAAPLRGHLPIRFASRFCNTINSDSRHHSLRQMRCRGCQTGAIESTLRMCPSCRQFTQAKITSSQQLQDLHHKLLSSGVQADVLTIVDGDLQWSDVMECTLRCVSCGQRFRLTCETYHGSGGTFGPIDSEA